MSQQQGTELEAALLARRTKEIELLPKVKVFLGAICRLKEKKEAFKREEKSLSIRSDGMRNQ